LGRQEGTEYKELQRRRTPDNLIRVNGKLVNLASKNRDLEAGRAEGERKEGGR